MQTMHLTAAVPSRPTTPVGPPPTSRDMLLIRSILQSRYPLALERSTVTLSLQWLAFCTLGEFQDGRSATFSSKLSLPLGWRTELDPGRRHAYPFPASG